MNVGSEGEKYQDKAEQFVVVDENGEQVRKDEFGKKDEEFHLGHSDGDESSELK